jgi:hypothetical protein
MDDGMPRDADGLRPCEWCGGPIRQPATGRRRRYCSRTHRQMAYEERVTQRRIGEALQAAAPPPPSDSSPDETRPIRVPSADETRRVRGAFAAGRRPLFREPKEQER